MWEAESGGLSFSSSEGRAVRWSTLAASKTGQGHIPRAFKRAALLTPDESHAVCQLPNCRMVNLCSLIALGLGISHSNRFKHIRSFFPAMKALSSDCGEIL